MTEAIESIQRTWRSLTGAQPGDRFLQHYRRSHRPCSVAKRVLRIGFGVALTAVGVLLWFLPGPGWLLVLLGMATLAGESHRLANFLDRLELYLRAQIRRLRR